MPEPGSPVSGLFPSARPRSVPDRQVGGLLAPPVECRTAPFSRKHASYGSRRSPTRTWVHPEGCRPRPRSPRGRKPLVRDSVGLRNRETMDSPCGPSAACGQRRRLSLKTANHHPAPSTWTAALGSGRQAAPEHQRNPPLLNQRASIRASETCPL